MIRGKKSDFFISEQGFKKVVTHRLDTELRTMRPGLIRDR